MPAAHPDRRRRHAPRPPARRRPGRLRAVARTPPPSAGRRSRCRTRMADAEYFVGELMPRGWADDSEWGFAIEAEGRYAGTVSLRTEGDGRAEIGLRVAPVGRAAPGTSSAALRLLLEWGFAERGLQTVIWWAHVGNWASRTARLAARVHHRGHGPALAAAARRAPRRLGRHAAARRPARAAHAPGSTTRWSRATASGCGRSPTPTCRGSSRASATRTRSTGSSFMPRDPDEADGPALPRAGDRAAGDQPHGHLGVVRGRTTTGCSASVGLLPARRRARGRLLDPPRRPRPRPDRPGRRARGPARVRGAGAAAARRLRLGRQHRLAAGAGAARHAADRRTAAGGAHRRRRRRSTWSATTCWRRSSRPRAVKRGGPEQHADADAPTAPHRPAPARGSRSRRR